MSWQSPHCFTSRSGLLETPAPAAWRFGEHRTMQTDTKTLQSVINDILNPNFRTGKSHLVTSE